MRQDDNRRPLGRSLAVLLLAILFLLAPSSAKAQFFGGCCFGGGSIRGGDAPIIDVADDDFCDVLTSEFVWVEAKLTAVESLGKRRTEIPQCFGVRITFPEFYHLHMQVERPLFGRGKAPTTLDLKELAIGEDYLYQNHFDQPPQVGDVVFVHLEYDEEGNWRPEFIGIPKPAERERIDRVKGLYEMPNSWRAAEAILSGFDDADPQYAIWCMRALSPADYMETESNKEAYDRFRSKIPVERYRDVLIELLETPDTLPATYVYVTSALRDLDLPEAEVERCHQAHCARLRTYLPQPADPHLWLDQDELTAIFDSFYWGETIARRRDVLQILGELAESPAIERRAAALNSASRLFSKRDAALNEEIFRLYSEHAPLHEQDQRLLEAYWSGLAQYLSQEVVHNRRVYDPALDLMEQKLPSATPTELSLLVRELRYYAENCRSYKEEWRRLTTRLRSFYSLTNSAKR